ncbi:MAG TPA: hypothetical protein PLZ75_06665 [Bacteroidales bacterium]|jgi:hypothetical protein|nr:hypothetical protein [Bacteroidales bacterium]HOU31147.1 hypothetical protein [Bacteroidales bacterium]HQH24802.1 hypothetical protein [Bacteroidales bacterium]
MEKKISLTNTKSEILNAYNELLKRIQDSKQESPKAEQEKKVKEATVEDAAKLTDEEIIGAISSLKLSLNSKLDRIEDDLTTERQKLAKIREAILIEDQRLKDLYQINAGADSLAVILAVQKEKKEEFERETTQRKSELEEEIRQEKLIRDKETKLWEENRKEAEETLKKQRVREEEEFQYNLKLTRKKDKDEYEQKKFQLEKELKEKLEAFDSGIKLREQSVAAAEQELEGLRSKAESFPAELEKAVQVAVKDVTSRLEKDYKFEKQLLLKDHEGEVKLKNQQIESLIAKINDLNIQLKQAYSKAENAENNSKEITLKAIQASGQIKIIEKEETRRKVEE